MFKQAFTTLFCFSFLFLTNACQAEKDVVMPDKPLEIALNMTSKELYDANSEFKDFQKFTRGPIGRDRKGFDFPNGSTVTAKFNYPNGQLDLKNISFVNVMDDTRVESYRLPSFTIATFLRGTDPKNITDKEAYEQVQRIFDPCRQIRTVKLGRF